MSDFSIPGVTSKYDTQKLIEGLMKVERIPRDRAEERLKAVQLQKTVWMDLGRHLSSLRDSSRKLFSFQNPFNERVATSSDPASLGATATREAIEETKTLQVVQTAAADRFMSDRLSKDTRVPEGSYTFSVGDKTVRLSYGGGTITDFVAALNRKGGDTVRAQLVNISADSRVLVLESLITGKDNRLVLSGAAEDLGLQLGIIEPGKSSARELPLDPPSRFEGALDTSKLRSSKGTLTVLPGGEAATRLPSPQPSAGMVMEIEVELAERPYDAPSGPAPGPSIPPTGGIEYEGIRIDSAPSQAVLPDAAVSTPPPRRDDARALYLIDGSGRSIPLPPLQPGGGLQKISVPLPAYADSVAGLGMRNANTHRDLIVKGVRIVDPTEVAGYRPKNPIDSARDAILKMDGIEITRPSNKIDDLIPGVTLEALRASKEPVTLKIEPDREAVKETIIELVGRYNRLMAEANILSRTEPNVLSEIEYFTAEERKTYEERLGLLQGDMTISGIRTSAQRIMTDPYGTRSGPMILSTLGISTNAGSSSGYNASRLRGYLEIDEKKLDEALKGNFLAVKDLFGYDSDGDLIVDSGVAYMLDTLTKSYVETGGILAVKNTTLDGQVSRIQKEIATLDVQLARKEADLKRKYGMMEGALGQMESTSSAWDNFNKQGSGQ